MTDLKKQNKNKTELVKQLIICFIQDLKLKPGDKLPTQTELRHRLGVGSTTIQSAINTLSRSGILDIRPHQGVYVKNLETDGFVARQIGLVSSWRTHIPSNASQMQCLQFQLHQNACQCKLFVRNFQEMTNRDSLSFFDGLRRCIEQHEIQGLISHVSFDEEALELFEKHNIPVLFLESATYNDGFKVCIQNMLPDYFKLAAKRGLERPAVLHCGYPQTKFIREIFRQNCSLDPEIYCRFMLPELVGEDAPFLWAGKLQNILKEFAGMSPDLRPDVLFIPDDILTSYAHQQILTMQRSGCDWDPYFIYSTCRQLPLIPAGSIRGDFFEYDNMLESEITVKLLLDMIAGKEKKPKTIYVKPKRYLMEDVK